MRAQETRTTVRGWFHLLLRASSYPTKRHYFMTQMYLHILVLTIELNTSTKILSWRQNEVNRWTLLLKSKATERMSNNAVDLKIIWLSRLKCAFIHRFSSIIKIPGIECCSYLQDRVNTDGSGQKQADASSRHYSWNIWNFYTMKSWPYSSKYL
jgi:hypothetical protein